MKTMDLIRGLLLAILVNTAHAETSAQECRHYSRAMSLVRQHTTYPVDFCKYYVSSYRSRTPLALDPKTLTQACTCLLKDEGSPVPKRHHANAMLHHEDASISCNKKFQMAIRDSFYEPKRFCSFYDAL
ncbi:hypothetical protein ANO11243_042080 [Dothideomycetidae sp. 11243]|nr:hypothetical protein ANO11243_042080 [fungal sp. No.11243]